MTAKAATAGTGRNPTVTVTVTLLLTSVIAATYGFGFYLFSVIVTDMRAELGFSYTAAGIITGSAQVGFLAFAFTGGLLAPRLGGGRVVLGSVLLCGISLTALPAFSNIWVIGALLTILGGCAASAYVPMVGLVSRLIRFEHRGKVLGLVSSGTSYGVFINGLIVPVFILQGDWRSIWLSVGVGTLVLTLIAASVFLRLGLLTEPRREHRLESSPEQASRPAPAPPTRAKLLPLDRASLVIWAITFLNGFTLLPFQNYLASYLRDELGFPVTVAGQVWAVIGFIGMGAGFAVGALADRIGIRASLNFTYACVLLSTVILAAVPEHGLLLVAGAAFALAFYPIFGLVPAYISKTTEGAKAVAVFGVANVTLGLGGMAGNFLGGWSRTATGTFVWIYVAVGAIALLLGPLSFLLPSERETRTG